MARPAPQPLRPIIGFKRAAQGPRRHLLQLRVKSRPHRETSGKELLFAEVSAELAANLIGKVIPRGNLRPKPDKIPVLHCAQFLHHLCLIGLGIQMAIFPHLAQHEIAPRQQALLLAHRVERARLFGHGSENCHLVGFQFMERLVEIALRCRRNPIGILP